jgi:hypothetical protein
MTRVELSICLRGEKAAAMIYYLRWAFYTQTKHLRSLKAYANNVFAGAFHLCPIACHNIFISQKHTIYHYIVN